MNQMKTERRDGMLIHWDMPIPMDDGITLRADIFRPDDENGRYPVIMSLGPYGKGVSFSGSHYAFAWKRIESAYPEITRGTSNKYANWEAVDPEKWVPDGFICIRVDSRGAGRSPGVLDIFSQREAKDYYNCIEWAAAQPWCTGKVGLNGISYYAINQWQVAALQPPHLTAICPFEGMNDFYREWYRHGGILNPFMLFWYPRQVITVQNGVGERGYTSPITGEYASGPQTLSEEELAKNRADYIRDLYDVPTVNNTLSTERSVDLSKVKVPVLSCANWGGSHLHLRGNVEGWLDAASEEKWLEVHGLEHFTEFYTDYGLSLQKRFFNHFLKGENTWADQPPVQLKLRRVDGSFVLRGEQEWPIQRTAWTKYYLDTNSLSLSAAGAGTAGKLTFDALGEGLTFWTAPLEKEMEITGPLASSLFISSSTKDADVFLVLRVVSPAGEEVTFISADDQKGLVATGWLRASHRKLDTKRTLPYRPYHSHDEIQPLTPGEIYNMDVEIWPTSVIVPAGYKIGLAVLGRDYVLPGDGPWPIVLGVEARGHGACMHNDERDRPKEIFGGKTTLYTGKDNPSYLLLPVIPIK